MDALQVYWSPRREGDRPIGRLWTEGDRLMVEAEDEAFSAEIANLLRELEKRQLCSRIVGVDFDRLELKVAPAYCLPEDTEYLEMLRVVVDEYSIGGRNLSGEVV